MKQQPDIYKKFCKALELFGLNPKAWRLTHEPMGPGAALVFEHCEDQSLKLVGRLGPREQLQDLELLCC